MINDPKQPFYLVERAVKYLGMAEIKDEKIKSRFEKALLKMADDYTVQDANKQHLAAVAIYYLGATGRFDDVILEMCRKVCSMTGSKTCQHGQMAEQNCSVCSNNSAAAQSSTSLIEVKLETGAKLLSTLVGVVGLSRSEKAEKFLIDLVGSNNEIVKRDRYLFRDIIRSLGNFDSAAVKEKLVGLLYSQDGWTRLIAYLALKKITGKEYRIDWLDPKTGDLSAEIDKYKKMLLN
jgi:hypothetical protein